MLFFVTGNPGLIGYYQTFLTLLYDLVRDGSRDIDHYVYGASLLGFERDDRWQDADGPSPPFSLRDQVDDIVRQIIETTKRVAGADEHCDSEPVQVILLGHSVGAYILLEVVARWQDLALHVDFGRQLDIVAGICLFPTVVDIARSPNGRMAAVSHVTRPEPTSCLRCLLYTSPSPRDGLLSRMPSSA